MKDFYYIYNNEALACCVFIAALNHCQTFDIARSCLLLPLVFDQRMVNYFNIKKIDMKNLHILQQLIDDKPHVFLSFNSRYKMLLPVCINSLIILSKYNLIEIGKNINIIKKGAITFENTELGERFNKISKVIPKIIDIMSLYSTDELYKILKIQL